MSLYEVGAEAASLLTQLGILNYQGGMKVVVAVTGLLSLYRKIKEVTLDLDEKYGRAILKSTITKSASQNYVRREMLEAQIEMALSAKLSGDYWVVYGLNEKCRSLASMWY
jgi:hypothetical protein